MLGLSGFADTGLLDGDRVLNSMPLTHFHVGERQALVRQMIIQAMGLECWIAVAVEGNAIRSGLKRFDDMVGTL